MHEKHIQVEMSRREIIFGLCFLPFYLILLSLALELFFWIVLHRAPSKVELNIGYQTINILIILLAFRRFLWNSLKQVQWKRSVIAAGIALPVYFFVSAQVNTIVFLTHPEFVNQNNDTIVEMLGISPIFVLLMSVVIAPIVEETLFRGLIFGNLLRVNEVVAYLITVLGFASIHVVGFIGVLSPVEILLSVVQYVPGALVLCACYQITGSIITPILLHSVINMIACVMMQILQMMG